MMAKRSFLPTRISKKRSFILIGLLLVIYIIENTGIISRFMSSFIFDFIFMPILWTGTALIVWCLPRIRPKGLLKLKGLVKIWSFIFAIMYIMITLLAGIIDGFGKSPYSHSLKGIFINIVFVGSALIGREFIRSYIVNSFLKKQNYIIFTLIALLMTFTNISLTRYIKIVNIESLVEFIAKTIGPEFAQNLLASYLVYLGGPVASIIYIGTIQGFQWLSPILPDLKWIITALIGILSPIFFMMTMERIYFTASKEMKAREKEEESLVSWIITSIISIGIIWFAVGVFPTYPSVIVTGSMKPMIKPGDVILVKKIVDMEGINNLSVDDVIQFKRGKILISHRIIDIYNDQEKGLEFKTKGDNNSSPDIELVKPEDIKGSIVYTVPKLGWPTLLIRSEKDIDLDKIEF